MELDGKYKYLEKTMNKTDIQLIQRISQDELKVLDLSTVDVVLVEPLDVDKFQDVQGFLVELPTTPKMLGKVIKSTVSNISEGDVVLYNNNYIAFKYFIDFENPKKMYFQISNDDIIMKDVKKK